MTDTPVQRTADPKAGWESAFPTPERRSEYNDILDYASPGLTKREWFAAMALQGIKANSIPGSHHIPSQAALEAVELADYLLKELAK